MRDLNFNHLRYFWLVAHEGSLTKAARQLNLSQSALSVQIQKLEHQMGHPLFNRVGRQLVLTEAGHIALDYADTVFKAGDELMSTLKGRPGLARQVLRVGALTTLSRNFQLEFLRPLVGRDDVELIVRSGTMRALLAELETHGLDVVLSNTPAPHDARSALRNYLLDQQAVSLVGKKDICAIPFQFPEGLKDIPVLLPGLESNIRIAFDLVLDKAGIRPTIMAEVDDMAMLRLFARDRDGLSLVPPIVVQDELRSGILIEYYRIPDITENFYAIIPKRKFPNILLTEVLNKKDDSI